MLDLAAHIIDKKSGHFKPEEFEDRYEKALVALVRSKQAGKPPPTSKDVPKPSNVINLMDALKRSVSAEKGGKAAARGGAKRAPAARARAGARSGAKRRAAG